MKSCAAITATLLFVYCLLQLTMIGCNIHQDGVDTATTEMTASGVVATLAVAGVVEAALTEGMILRREAISLDGHEEAIIMGASMEMLCQEVIRMVEKPLVNKHR